MKSQSACGENMTRKSTSYRERLLASLVDPSEAEAYLNAALEDSQESFLKGLKNVAQAHQMAKVAREAGVQRETLYRSLSSEGNPTFDTLLSILKAVGLRINVERIEKAAAVFPALTYGNPVGVHTESGNTNSQNVTLVPSASWSVCTLTSGSYLVPVNGPGHLVTGHMSSLTASTPLVTSSVGSTSFLAFGQTGLSEPTQGWLVEWGGTQVGDASVVITGEQQAGRVTFPRVKPPDVQDLHNVDPELELRELARAS